MKTYLLGEMVKDSVTDTQGMLTHLTIDMDKNEKYIYQPKGLNPETQQPVDKIFIDKTRIIGGTKIELEIPFEILGSQVEDIASGFKGTVIGFVYHLDGCLHVDVKPKGTLANTGATIQSHEFDIRRMKGDKIPKLTKFKLKKSIKEVPSPESLPKFKYNK